MKVLHYIPLAFARLSLLVSLLIATTATTAAVITKDVTGTIGYTKVTGEEEWSITGDLYLTDCIDVAERAKLTIKNATPSLNTFTFTNTPKSDTPPHSGAIKKN